MLLKQAQFGLLDLLSNFFKKWNVILKNNRVFYFPYILVIILRSFPLQAPSETCHRQAKEWVWNRLLMLFFKENGITTTGFQKGMGYHWGFHLLDCLKHLPLDVNCLSSDAIQIPTESSVFILFNWVLTMQRSWEPVLSWLLLCW